MAKQSSETAPTAPTSSQPPAGTAAAKGKAKRFEVAIEGGYRGIFEATDPQDAQNQYLRHFGVRSTSRKMTCEEVTDDPEAGKLASEHHKEIVDGRAVDSPKAE